MAHIFQGIVSSAHGNKTIVVTVKSRKTHPLYHKQYSVSKKFMAHDEKNQAKLGDHVAIIETRPISARKHFKLDKIISKPTISGSELENI